MPIFDSPTGLVQVAHFTVPAVRTWGRPDDRLYKEQVRRAAGLAPESREGFEWFVFCIRCVVGESRDKVHRQVPDVENIPKLIVDAFSGILYPDDDLHHVRGVQVEAEWGPDEEERAEVRIYGWTREGAIEEELRRQEHWDAQRAHSRSLSEMRRIAQEALALPDDYDAVYPYAVARGLTVNEVVYYVNAYEAGKDDGLRALVAPDIIPEDIARHVVQTIDAALREHFQEGGFYRMTDEGTAIGVYEIQQRWQTKEPYLFPVCQFRLTGKKWHLYWMRKFDAWWPYRPPEHGHKFTLQARLQQLLDDEDGCFWG
jgi:hypothetical protein